MFIDKNELITVEVYYFKQGHSYAAYPKPEYEKLSEDLQSKCTKLCVKMKPLTWGLHNDLQEMSVDEDQDGNRHFNYKKYKENRLQHLIKEWDAKDEEGKIASINQNVISNIAPSIAETILNTYSLESFLGEEEEGN